jgi:hypothetical protein
MGVSFQADRTKKFFSEEKNQKTFNSDCSQRDPGHGLDLGGGGGVKVFCFRLSSEKKTSFFHAS